MSNDAAARGKLGEKLAADYLVKKNYTIVASGWRSRFGEVDIIAKNPEFLLFVEVKLRKNDVFAEAREYVGKAKQRKIRATAGLWLATHEGELQPRFDVIEIYMPDETSNPRIIHIENAF